MENTENQQKKSFKIKFNVNGVTDFMDIPIKPITTDPWATATRAKEELKEIEYPELEGMIRTW